MRAPPLPVIARRCLAAVAVLAPVHGAAQYVPFATYDQSPFAGIHGLPDGATLAGGIDLLADVTNNFREQQHADEALLVDGESYRIALAATFAFAERWRARLTVPLVAHAGKLYRVGGLDARNATTDEDEDLPF